MSLIYGKTVTLFNRTKKVLSVRFDGRDQDIVPGKNPGFPEVAVQYAKNQNPLMGTEDPENPTLSGCQYLVGVKVWGDDVSPVEQSNAPQRYDRSILHEEGTKEYIKKRRVSSLEAQVPQNQDL